MSMCGCAGRAASDAESTNLAAKKFAEGLPEVPQIQVFSDVVTAALGMNPGPFTLMGSNTYLVGTGKKRILIDTGEGLDEYIPVLEKAMEESGCDGIQEVLITHYHFDHVGGIESIQKRWGPGIKVSKYIPSSAELASYEENMGAADDGSENMEGDRHGPIDMSQGFSPLEDGALIETDGASLRVIHTPGHTADHVAFYLEQEKAVFTGDCVLGVGTAVFTDLQSYMSSLERILQYGPSHLYCGHGPKVLKGSEWINQYVNHRNTRERVHS